LVWQVAVVQIVTELLWELGQEKTTVQDPINAVRSEMEREMAYAEEKCTGRKKSDDFKYVYS
jgi:hypothetical protein